MCEDVLTHQYCATPAGHCSATLPPSFTGLLQAQIFSDNLPDVVVVHAQLTCNQSNSQLMIVIHHMPHVHNVLPVEGLLLHLPHPCIPLWTFCATTWKPESTSYFCTLAAVVQVLLMEFSPAGQGTSGWFGALYPSLEGLELRRFLKKKQHMKKFIMAAEFRYYITLCCNLLILTLLIAYTAH